MSDSDLHAYKNTSSYILRSNKDELVSILTRIPSI